MKADTKKNGFTLIELLVVISIIALLLSILMPALTKVKEKGKLIVCRSNQRQLALAFNLYAVENNDWLWENTDYWIPIIAPYVARNQKSTGSGFGSRTTKGRLKVIECPSTKPFKLAGSSWIWAPTAGDLAGVGTAKMMSAHSVNNEVFSSYGVNAWVMKWPPNDCPLGCKGRYGLSHYSRFTTLKSNIPIVSDAVGSGHPGVPGTPRGSNPEQMARSHADLLDPAFRFGPRGINWHMPRWTIDRHNKAINVAFADLHCEQVSLDKVVALPWHKQFDRSMYDNWARALPRIFAR